MRPSGEKPLILSADITISALSHRLCESLCAGDDYWFKKVISKILLKLGGEPVTSSVAGECVSHSATVNRQNKIL